MSDLSALGSASDGTNDNETFQPLTQNLVKKWRVEYDLHNHFSTILRNLNILHTEDKLLDITIRPDGDNADDEKKFHMFLLASYNPELPKSFFDSDGEQQLLSSKNLRILHQFVYQSVEKGNHDDEADDSASEREILEITGIDIRDWNPDKLSENLKKLLTKKKIPVLNLTTTDNKSVPIHSALLAASSPYFKEKIASDEMEILDGSLKVNVNSTTMDVLVDFIYTASLSVDQLCVTEIFVASCTFQFPDVHDACTQFLSELLKPDNAPGIMYLASLCRSINQHYGENLYLTAVEYIAKKFKVVSKEDEFLDMSASDLQDILKDENFVMKNDDEALIAVIKWYEASEGRSCSLGILLEHLSLADMSHSALSWVAEKVEHLEDCSSMLEKALYAKSSNFHYNQADSAAYPHDDDDNEYIPSGEVECAQFPVRDEPEAIEKQQSPSCDPRKKNGQPDARFKVNRNAMLNKDGEPDMRFKANKEAWVIDQVSKMGVPLTKHGEPDIRFRVNKEAIAKMMKETLAGEPDRRYAVNKNAEKATCMSSKTSVGPVKADGTPDMRFKVNKEDIAKQLTPVKSDPTQFQNISRKLEFDEGPLKKDGTPDMRFKENKVLAGSGSYAEPVQVTIKPASSSVSMFGPTKHDGTPDMRYTVNKEAANHSTLGALGPSQSFGGYSGSSSSCYSSLSGPTKRDGTPDMRYTANKVSLYGHTGGYSSSNHSGGGYGGYSGSSYGGSSGGSSSYSSGPLKSNGTPDMRFKANRH